MSAPVQPAPSTDTPSHDPAVVLERLRGRLLDLSARNPLLHYRHPGTKSIRFIDEVPAEVYASLRDGTTMTVLPLVPPRTGPTAVALMPLFAGADGEGAPRDAAPGVEAIPEDEELARRARQRAATTKAKAQELAGRRLAIALGLNPSYDLPAVHKSTAAHHQDSKLQTLLDPESLERRCDSIAAAARTYLEEHGANILHLTFGFLEWAESGAPEAPRRVAPLMLLPVGMTGGPLSPQTGTSLFTLKSTGEDASVNITLLEKARREFGLELPTLGEDEALESYFARVEAMVATAPGGWRVHRWITLGLFSFGKLLMWKDLHPGAWPTDAGPLANPHARAFLGDREALGAVAGGGGGSERLEPHPIDALPTTVGGAPPLVADADSSQHSVLIDVHRGESLVVQGPPGTGKSQTITNLIATALGRGQKVLFLAEKKAALDVVLRRLEDAGLGAFCLPLHSQTSDKKTIVYRLMDRLRLRDQLSAGTLATLRRTDGSFVGSTPPTGHTPARETLAHHAARWHRPVGAAQITPFRLLWKAAKEAQALPAEFVGTLQAVRIPRAFDRTIMDVLADRAALDVLERCRAELAELGLTEATHPWRGLTVTEPSATVAEGVHAAARRWAAGVEDLVAAAVPLLATLEPTADAPARVAEWTPDALTRLSAQAASCPQPAAVCPDDLPARLAARDDQAPVRDAIQRVGAAQAAWRAIPGPWGMPGALARTAAQALLTDLQVAQAAFGPSTTVAQMTTRVAPVAEWRASVATATDALGDLVALLGVAAPTTVAGLRATLAGLQTAQALTPAMAPYRHDGLTGYDAAAMATRVQTAHEALVTADATLATRAPRRKRPTADVLAAHERAVATARTIWPSLFNPAYRAAVEAHQVMTGARRTPRATMHADYRALTEHAADVAAWGAARETTTIVGPHSDGLDTPTAALTALATWYATALPPTGLPADADRVLRALWGADNATFATVVARVHALPATVWEAAAALEHSHTAVAALSRTPLGALTADAALRALAQSTLAVAREIADDLLTCTTTIEAAAANAAVADSTALSALAAHTAAVLTAWQAEDAVDAALPLLLELGIARAPTTPSTALGLECAPLLAALAWLDAVAQHPIPMVIKSWLRTGGAHARSTTLREFGAALNSACTAHADAWNALASAGRVDVARWTDGEVADTAVRATLGTLSRRLTEALADEAQVYSGIRLARALAEVGARDLHPLITLRDKLPVGTLAAAYEVAFAHSVLATTCAQDLALGTTTSDGLESARARFRDLDLGWQEETRRAIVDRLLATPARPGQTGAVVDDRTEEALIRHEGKKQRRHIPTRKLFARAGRAILDLTPCLMMSPQTVAQYLAPGDFAFDLVIMDEASQLRPEDALGAIVRGAQLVIVGDPQQLGPSSFFDTTLSDSDEDLGPVSSGTDAEAEALRASLTVTEQQESILTAAATLFPVRMLRWHYRSQHPGLIAFSNQHFYQNNLFVLPSARATDPTLGVQRHYVESSNYAGGINMAEAEAVVAGIRRHAEGSPNESLLVVAMNADQADCITGLVQAAERTDPHLAAFREQHAETLEPFAIKALENVQGDERDVVMISLTYGPAASGILRQNFGPLNKAGGARRLNVLFSRAKRRLALFTSFRSDMLRTDATSPEGLKVLQDYLRYAEGDPWGMQTLSAREPDSDFERVMAAQLTAAGLEVVPQVGIAGYFIDLAIRHPDAPGRFILGVECDGETYHRAASARDRDRLRDSHLTALGWTMHRVWSTDFFRNPSAQVRRIVERVHQIREANAPHLAMRKV